MESHCFWCTTRTTYLTSRRCSTFGERNSQQGTWRSSHRCHAALSFVRKNFLRAFDAVVLAQPWAAMFIPSPADPVLSQISFERFLRGLPRHLAEALRVIRSALPGRRRFHDYDRLWKKILDQQNGDDVQRYPGAFVDWDNTPRYERTARIVIGANLDRFRYWFAQLVDSVTTQPRDRRLIFVNAWNEWAEGAYLEPDERFRFGYLEAIRDSVSAT